MREWDIEKSISKYLKCCLSLVTLIYVTLHNHIPNFSYLTNFVPFATLTKGQFTRSHINCEVDSWHHSRQLLCKQSKPESVLIKLYNWHVSYSIVPFTWSVLIASHNIVTGYRLAYYAQCEPKLEMSGHSLSTVTIDCEKAYPVALPGDWR